MMNPFENIQKHEIALMAEKLTLPSDEFTFRRIFTYLDFTSLDISDTEESIGAICDKLNNFPYVFPDLPGVAAICVYPRFVKLVRERLTGKRIRIASVGGSFPSSQSFTSVKAEECRLAVEAGADEIDMVLSAGDFIAGNLTYVENEIRSIREAVGKAHLKVILETGVIDSPFLIYEASMIAMRAGADFIKTSTGKTAVSATPEAAWVMCSAIKDFHAETGKRVGFKPAGGISTSQKAALYYTIVENILGREWLVPHHFRIGASRLANDLLKSIEGRTADYF
ncbi:MAG: deoxyribose-phosphate aldolase [Bacteroidales bacterium]|nr:deoxyribose-phosphate aldolase [Bacteroidales bacterium]